MRTLDVYIKTWHDKVNGNSYFSAQAIEDYGTDAEKKHYIPFQHGYGSHPEWVVKAEVFPGTKSGLSMTCRDNGIILRVVTHSVTKRECERFGKVSA